MQLFPARLAALPFVLLLAGAAPCQESPKPGETKPAESKPAQKHLVRFSFKQGAVRRSVLEMDMTMTMNMGAKDMETKTTTTVWTTTTVKSATGNVAEIENKVTRIKAVADSLLLKVDYDSDDEDSDPGPMEGLDELVGKVSTTKLTDQGKVSGAKVADAANDLMAGGLDLNEILKSTVTQLPDRPIAIGETWKVDQKFPLGDMGKADGTMHYKLLAVDKKAITLQQKLVLDTKKLQVPGAKEFTITSKGTSRLDLLTGAPIEMDMTTTTKMSGAVTMNMVMRQRIKPAAKAAKKPAKPETRK